MKITVNNETRTHFYGRLNEHQTKLYSIDVELSGRWYNGWDEICPY